MIESPPGLADYTAHEVTHTSREDLEWNSFENVKLYTNAFVLSKDGSQILLGLKKRGFGVNKFNGFGGKVEPDESPLDAASRELKEEAGIDAPLYLCGLLFFKLAGLNFAHKVFIFRADEYSGEVTESDEMKPQWFSVDASPDDGGIPYDSMWADDRYWLHFLLAKTPFIGRADLGDSPTGDNTGLDAPMTRTWFAKVNSLSN